MSVVTIACSALSIIFACATVLFGQTSNHYTRQTIRIMRGQPEQPKPWYVRLADPMLGGRKR